MPIIYSGITMDAELNVYECGEQNCEGGYKIGPSVRNCYILHFIRGGCGTFTNRFATYRLSKGQAFLICPDTLIQYQADADDPWRYSWVCFNGKTVINSLARCGLSEEAPVFSFADTEFIKKTFEEMKKAGQLDAGRSSFLKGYFYILLSYIMEHGNSAAAGPCKSPQDTYLQKAVELIKMHYGQKMDIRGLSAEVGIDSKYLWRIFKSKTGRSPSGFLISTRMDKAGLLLRSTTYSVSYIARSVGYDDSLQFSKIFKKFRGCSPLHFRKKFFMNIVS